MKRGVTLAGDHHAERRVKKRTSPLPSPRSGEGEAPNAAELQAKGVVCLTKTQMAAALQISVRSLNSMMARGDVAFFRLGPRLIRFRVEEALKRMRERVLVAAED